MSAFKSYDEMDADKRHERCLRVENELRQRAEKAEDRVEEIEFFLGRDPLALIAELQAALRKIADAPLYSDPTAAHRIAKSALDEIRSGDIDWKNSVVQPGKETL